MYVKPRQGQTETALARVIRVFGEARAHHAYLFANQSFTSVRAALHQRIEAAIPVGRRCFDLDSAGGERVLIPVPISFRGELALLPRLVLQKIGSDTDRGNVIVNAVRRHITRANGYVEQGVRVRLTL